MPLRAILFDLFGTVIYFKALPSDQASGQKRSIMPWLSDFLVAKTPGLSEETFLTELKGVSAEIVRQRPPEHLEVSSPERFRRALLRSGVEERLADLLAAQLCQKHMAGLAALTFLPDGHREALESLGSRYRLALVSNFDHGPTAHEILSKHGLREFFDEIVISDDVGRRKPHPEIFEIALNALCVDRDEAIYIGDSLGDDVVGATNTGLQVVWRAEPDEVLPEGHPQPSARVTSIAELGSVVGGL